MRHARQRNRRRGLSLLEVLVALAVFLFSYAAIWQLMNMAGDQAIELATRNEATRIGQSVLARIAIGDLPMESSGDMSYDDDADYSYSVDVQEGVVESLQLVSVTVTHPGKSGNAISGATEPDDALADLSRQHAGFAAARDKQHDHKHKHYRIDNGKLRLYLFRSPQRQQGPSLAGAAGCGWGRNRTTHMRRSGYTLMEVILAAGHRHAAVGGLVRRRRCAVALCPARPAARRA